MRGLLWPAWLGLRLICPACEQGAIYRSGSELHRQCPHCGVAFEREEGDFIGAMVIAYSLTAVIVVIGIFVVASITSLSATGHLILWSLFSILFVLLTYRNMKGLWIGILHWMVGLRRREQ